MDQLITVATFTYTSENAMAQHRLEAEGIECFLQDEHSVNLNPFSSTAIGGIKLQVWEADVERALSILKDGGYIIEGNAGPSKLKIKLDRITLEIPLIKKAPYEFRIILLLGTSFTILFFIALWLTSL